jgi:dienelactone hydrolase
VPTGQPAQQAAAEVAVGATNENGSESQGLALRFPMSIARVREDITRSSRVDAGNQAGFHHGMVGGVRIASGVAFAVFLVATAWLGRLERGGPAQGDLLLAGGVPATLYLPGRGGGTGRAVFLDPPPRGERPPAIVLMHGFSGDRLSLSSLARRLAASGYAVLSIDASGHGDNRNPLRHGFVRSDVFQGDLAAAVDHLRLSPFVDGERIALVGHSMGAGAALDFATRDAGIDAAVLISGGRRLDGPYRPPNALFLVAEGDPAAIRDRAALLVARLAEVERAEAGRGYGSFPSGTAVRLAVVPGADHLSIVWRGDTVREMVAWLDAAFGISRHPAEVPADARIPALVVMALAFVGVLPGLGLLVAWLAGRRDPLPAVRQSRGLALLVVALVAAMPLLATGTPAEIVSAELLDSVVANFALAGVGLLLWIRWREPGLLGWVIRDPAAPLLAAGLGILAVFSLTSPFGVAVHRVTLTPERMLVFAMAAAGFFPLSLAFACVVRRGPALGALLFGLAGRALVVLFLGAGIAVGLLPFVLLLMFPMLCVAFALTEFLACFVYAGSRNLLAIALVDAGWLAAIAAAVMPLRV